MKPEIEAVFLNIDKEGLRKKLKKLGARLIAKDVRYWPKIVFEEMPEGLKGKVMRKRG